MGKMPKELEKLKEICFVCNQPLFLLCGTPKVVIGGCCIGAKWKGKIWLFSRSAHLHCYLNMKKKPKLMLTDEEVLKKLRKAKLS